MTNAAPATNQSLRPMMRAREVSEAITLAIPTVYEIARTDPDRLGAVYFGRSVRFRRETIERIVRDKAEA